MQQVNALPTQTATPLALNDIHLPEQVSNFPMAYGWWLLAVIIIVAVIFLIIKIRRSAKRNQVKKQALAQLKQNANINNNDIIALLKWAAMHYFSRAELAKLYGHSLQQFLMSKLPITKQQNFSELSEQAFVHQYQADNLLQNDDKLEQAATLWLTHALPPKPLKKAVIKSTTENEIETNNKKISQGVNA